MVNMVKGIWVDVQQSYFTPLKNQNHGIRKDFVMLKTL